MDLSKLPKLSKTTPDPPPPQPPPRTDPDVPNANLASPVPRPPGAIGADIWFTAVIALLCIFLGKTFAVYLFARATGQPFHSGWTLDDPTQEIPYSQVPNHQMLTDAGIFFFGVVLLLEVAMKTFFELQWHVPRFVISLILLLALFTTALNLYACYVFLHDGAVPIISGLATAFGGYIVTDIWRILAMSRPIR